MPTLAHLEHFFSQIDIAPKSEVTYRQALKTLAEFLSLDQAALPELTAASVIPLTTLKEDTLPQFRHWLRTTRKYGRRTESTYLAGAARFLNWLEANNLLPAGLTAARMNLLLKEARGRRRAGYKTQPIKEAVPLILEHLDNTPLPTPDTPRRRQQRLNILRNRALAHMLFASGMRANELTTLRRSDCNDGLADKILITGKGEKERLVGLNAEAQQAIRAYLRARDADRRERGQEIGRQDPLFVRHDRDRALPISTKTLWLVIHDAARDLGLDSSVSPHDFRRYIATSMLSEGMPLESVQAFLGHESIVTTRTVYARTWSEVLDDQVNTYRPTPKDAANRARKKRADGN